MKEFHIQDAMQAWRWFQKAFGLLDWEVKIIISEVAPDWVEDKSVFASIKPYLGHKTARIWLNLPEHTKYKESLLASLFHELGHLWALSCCLSDDDSNGPAAGGRQFGLNRFGLVMTTAYQSGIEIVDRYNP